MAYRERGSAAYIFIIFTSLLMCSVCAWRLEFLRYDIGNFDVVLASRHPLLPVLLMTASAVVLALSTLRSRRYSSTTLLAFLGYLYVVLAGPLITNPPAYIHRDVFLHLPYSLLMAEHGRIPSPPDRPDVVSYPSSFILYAAYIHLTGISEPRSLGLAIAAIYPLLLAVSMLTLARAFYSSASSASVTCGALIPTMLTLPYISRFAPAPGFPHRYHLAFIQTTLLLYVFVRLMERRRTLGEVLSLVLLYSFLTFTHPYFSFLLAVAMIAHCVLILLLGKNSKRSELALLCLVIPLTMFVTHSLYLAYKGILREAYTITLRLPDRLMDFVEVSLPVRVKATDPLIALVSTAARNLWRIYIVVTSFGTALTYMYVLTKRGSRGYAVSLAVASAVVTPLLLASFLWWERSLTFIALTLFCALHEICHEVPNGKTCWRVLGFLRDYMFPSLFVFSIAVTTLVRWERPQLSDCWQGGEKEAFMTYLAEHARLPEIYMGLYSAVDYTYYRVYLYPYRVPEAKTIFDPVKGVLVKDIPGLTGVYAVSVRDPDYEVLGLELLLTTGSVIWCSSASYTFLLP